MKAVIEAHGVRWHVDVEVYDFGEPRTPTHEGRAPQFEITRVSLTDGGEDILPTMSSMAVRAIEHSDTLLDQLEWERQRVDGKDKDRADYYDGDETRAARGAW